MIDFFETSVRIHPDDIFFTYTSENGVEFSYTYWQSRLISAALARKLRTLGIRPNSTIAIDLPNCPEYIFIILASAYCGYTMVMLDHSLSESEKMTRTLEAERSGIRISMKVDAPMANRLLREVRRLPDNETDIIKSVYGQSRRSRSIMGEDQDAIDDTVHFAERAAHLFDKESTAVVMFAGGKDNTDPGKRKKIKAVPLTWEHIINASMIINDYLQVGGSQLWQERLPFNSFGCSGNLSSSGKITSREIPSSPDAVWQCVLPLSKIAGFQVLVRSVVAKTPLRLYGNIDAERILRDSEGGKVTHIAVDDTVLQDLITVEEWRSDAIPGISSRLSRYQCVMFVDRKRNARTMKRAFELGTRIVVSYNMTETSGTIAASLITAEYKGGIKPLNAYEVHIIDPDDEGFGRLAVKGPGVFDGYLNTRTAFTIDRFFITEEKAAIFDGQIFIKNRSENMFVSAGQNIFPIEIADVLRHVPGVIGVHVFGVSDARYGMLPVAAIERNDPLLTPAKIKETTHSWFSNIGVPISYFVFDHLPRDEFGKLDRASIEAAFNA